MALDSPTPGSFPVSQENESVKRRAVFSSSFAGLESHHALSPDEAPVAPRRRKVTHDDSLRLIDDLVNRSVDPMFSDSRLVRGRQSKTAFWTTRLVVFLICILVGVAGSVFVQQLHTDPRRSVRQSLAEQLQDRNEQIDDLTDDINELRSEVDQQSKALSGTVKSSTLLQDEMINGQTSVEGEGIILTIADPIAANQTGTDSASNHIRVVTDRDLQTLVSLLFQNGAEAIAINGNRIGVQTSIRTAGGHILIGTTAVQSPYAIEAIGDKDGLSDAMSQKNQKTLYESFTEAGMTPQVKKTNSITLKAAVTSELSYARRRE